MEDDLWRRPQTRRRPAPANVPLDATDLYRSEVFPGLWLDPAALIRGDLAHALKVLQQGLATPEHAAFVEDLNQQKPTA